MSLFHVNQILLTFKQLRENVLSQKYGMSSDMLCNFSAEPCRESEWTAKTFYSCLNKQIDLNDLPLISKETGKLPLTNEVYSFHTLSTIFRQDRSSNMVILCFISFMRKCLLHVENTVHGLAIRTDTLFRHVQSTYLRNNLSNKRMEKNILRIQS